MDVEPSTLATPDSDADSLVSSNDPDDMANEQTWPTEEEMQGNGAPTSENGQDVMPDANNGTTPKTVRRIPTGMSEYQAAWILDDDEDEDGSERDAKDGDEEMDEEEEMVDAPIEDDDLESRRSVAFQDLDEDEEERKRKKAKAKSSFLEEELAKYAQSRGVNAKGKKKKREKREKLPLLPRRQLRG